MNIVHELLREHSKSMCDHVVTYVGKNPVRFKELVNAFLNGPYRVTQRAAWLLSYCVERHPELIKPHLRRIINNLKTPKILDSVKRNTIRLLQFIRIPVSLQGPAATSCFEYLNNPKEPIAIRVFSMSVLSAIAREQPELRKELRIIIEDQMPYGSAAFTSRARAILKELNHHLQSRWIY